MEKYSMGGMRSSPPAYRRLLPPNAAPQSPAVKATGFASPAQGYEAKNIDLNSLLIRNPPATFLMRCVTNDMSYYGIFDGTLLVIDRSLKPVHGSIAVLAADGVFLCRQIKKIGKKYFFTDGKTDISANEDIEIFGIVRASINDHAH